MRHGEYKIEVKLVLHGRVESKLPKMRVSQAMEHEDDCLGREQQLCPLAGVTYVNPDMGLCSN